MATNAFAAFIEGQQAGQRARAYQQQQEDRNALRTLAPQILAGDVGAFNQAAAIDPKAATAVQDAGDSQLRRLRGALDYFGQALETGDDRVIQARFKEISPFLSRVTGKPAPPAWTEEMRPAFEQARQRVAMAPAAAGEATPSQFRALHLQALAAGYQPGTDGYRDFFRRANGEIARQSSAAIQYKEVTGPDGRTYLVALDPRGVGATTIGGGPSFGSFAGPVQGQPSAAPGAARAGAPADAEQAASAAQSFYDRMRAAGLDDAAAAAATNAYLADMGEMTPAASAAPAAAHSTSPAPVQDRLLVSDPVNGGLAGGGNPFASRTPEEQAAATEAAKLGVQLQYLPTELAMRGRAAVDQAVGIERGKTAVEQAAAAPAAIETMQSTIKVIDELLADPDLGTIVGMGSVNPLNYLPGSKARGLIARAEQISGKAFLAAFNQLKGAGAITEKEGEAATRAMARLDRSQSLEDYRTALIDLRDAIAPALARQQAILSRGQGPAQPQTAGAPRVQTPDDYARLPSGATYIAPDGSVRRKK